MTEQRKSISLPFTAYLVAQHYGDLGLGSPDMTHSRDVAYDLFAAAVDDGHEVSVWEIQTTGSEPVRIIDVTDRFERELQETCIERRLDMPNVLRFHAPHQPYLWVAE